MSNESCLFRALQVMAHDAAPMAKPTKGALKTDDEKSTKPAVFPPALYQKPYDDFLCIDMSDADGRLSHHSSCRLGSWEETEQYTQYPVLASGGCKKMAFLLSTADYRRPCGAQERANVMTKAGSGATNFNERVKRLKPNIPFSATSDEPGSACLFQWFAGFNDPVEPGPDTVTVFIATSSAGHAHDIQETTQGDAQHVKQVPIGPRQRNDRKAAPRKVPKKEPVPRAFKKRRRLGEASMNRETTEMKTNLSGMQLWLCRTVGAVIAALLVVGLVAFCCSYFAASTMSPAVRNIDIHMPPANHNVDLCACAEGFHVFPQKSDAATKTTLIHRCASGLNVLAATTRMMDFCLMFIRPDGLSLLSLGLLLLSIQKRKSVLASVLRRFECSRGRGCGRAVSPPLRNCGGAWQVQHRFAAPARSTGNAQSQHAGSSGRHFRRGFSNAALLLMIPVVAADANVTTAVVASPAAPPAAPPAPPAAPPAPPVPPAPPAPPAQPPHGPYPVPPVTPPPAQSARPARDCAAESSFGWLDPYGYTCADWQGYNCDEYPGCTAAEMADLRLNCPRCCGIPLTCAEENSFGWLDPYGFSCADWQGYNCFEYPGCTAAEMDDLRLNCPSCCGLFNMPPAPALPPAPPVLPNSDFCEDVRPEDTGYGCRNISAPQETAPCSCDDLANTYQVCDVLDYMRKRCPQSCGVCRATPSRPPPTLPAPPTPPPSPPNPPLSPAPPSSPPMPPAPPTPPPTPPSLPTVRYAFEIDDASFSTGGWQRSHGSTPMFAEDTRIGTGVQSGPKGNGSYYYYTDSRRGGEGDVYELRYDGLACIGGQVGTIRFSYAMYGQQMGSLEVVASDGTAVWSAKRDHGLGWHRSSAAPRSARFSFRAVRGYGSRSDVAVGSVWVTCEHMPPPAPLGPPSPPILPPSPPTPSSPPLPALPPRMPPPPVPSHPPPSAPTPPHVPSPPHTPPALCSDGGTCSYRRDGDCDDGGPGAEYTLCPFASDCSDCGPRWAPPPLPHTPPSPPPSPPARPPPQEPPPPPKPPPPPASPPTAPPQAPPLPVTVPRAPPVCPPEVPPPLPPTAPGVVVVASSASLSATVSTARPGDSLALFVPEAVRLQLGGAALVLDNITLTIRSSGSGAILDGQGLSRHFHLRNGAVLRLGAVTLQNGRSVADGGSLLLESGSSCTLSGSAILNAAATSSDEVEVRGGAVCLTEGSSCTLSGSAITNAAATSSAGRIRGGAVFLTQGSSFRLIDSTIRGSAAESPSTSSAALGGGGGAVHCREGSSLDMFGSAIVNVTTNIASRFEGGAVILTYRHASTDAGCNANLTGSTIANIRTTVGGDFYGGALLIHVFNADVSDSIIANLSTTADGSVSGGAVTLDRRCNASLTSVTIINLWTSAGANPIGGIVESKGNIQEGRCTIIVSGSTFANVWMSAREFYTGGAMYLTQSNARLDGLTIANLSMSVRINIGGGAIDLITDSIASMRRLIIANLSMSAGDDVCGAAMRLRSSCSVNLTGSTIANLSTSAGGVVAGGAMQFGYSCSAHLTDSTIANLSTSAGRHVYGGAMLLEDHSNASMRRLIIANLSTSAGRDLVGGAISLRRGCNVPDMSSLTISDVTVNASGDAKGGALALLSSNATMSGSTISDVTVNAGGRAEGGALALHRSAEGGALATLASNTSIERCHASSASGDAKGGAMFVSESIVRFSDRTALRSNTVSRGGVGSTIYMVGAQTVVDYVFPAPPGTWLAALECRVDREPCPTEPWDDAQACEAIATTSCTYIANRTASVGGVPCPDTTFFQPCRWMDMPGGPALLGKTVFNLPCPSATDSNPRSRIAALEPHPQPSVRNSRSPQQLPSSRTSPTSANRAYSPRPTTPRTSSARGVPACAQKAAVSR